MIKLLTVIGHGSKLLPHFIEHYKNQVLEDLNNIKNGAGTNYKIALEKAFEVLGT